MQRVLVTGATGFIGQHLINLLKLEGMFIRAIGRTLVPNVDTVVCDFLNDNIPENTFKDIDIVFHLAGYTHDLKGKSWGRNTYQRMNVDITAKLLSLSVESNVERFVFVSSVKAGGVPTKGECASEENQREPDGVYGKTKRDAELKVLEVGRESDMCVSILRPSLIYGPNVKGNLQLMKLGIKKGWFPPLPEIENRRSMTHVDDIVRALL
ncbi:NAD-dependent epimerase/dehydratase family protein, partial [Candidatus Woesearchaeota archaeon]|nr:NAD-dependent epimerase/dehydratase family protein [Candidatus Woesearchaeota archaeon]